MNDTNVFRETASAVPRPHPARDRKPLYAFGLCLLLGVVVVWWHAVNTARQEKDRAQAETTARALALENQLNASLSTAEVLATLVRQAGGLLPNFSQRAAELIATHPCVDSLEMQPGGVVSDVAPRAGHEKAIGKNIFSNPALRPAAMSAFQTRRLAAGALPLARGGYALVGLAPVHLTGRDGRETFWGFAAANVRLADVALRARLDELVAKDYDFLLFMPEQAGQPAAGIVASGTVPRQGCVGQVVQAGNFTLKLAVHPRHGWYNGRSLTLWILGALAVAALAGGLFVVLGRRMELSDALSRANSELMRAREETTQVRVEQTRLQEQLARAEAQVASEQKQVARAQEQLAAAHDQAARAAQEMARSREDFALARTELQREKQEAVTKAGQLAADLEQLTLAHAQQAAERDQMVQSNEQLARDHQEISRTNEQLLREKERLGGTIGELNGQLQNLTRASERLREQLAKSNEQIASTSEHLAREKENLAQSHARATRAEEQLKQSARRIEELEQQLAARPGAPSVPSAVFETEAPAVVTLVTSEAQPPEIEAVEPPVAPPVEETAPVPAPDPDPAPAASAPAAAPVSDSPPWATTPPVEEVAPAPPPASAVDLKPAIRTHPPRQRKARKDDQLSLFVAPAPAAPAAPTAEPDAQTPPPAPSRSVTLVEEPLAEETAVPATETAPPPAPPAPEVAASAPEEPAPAPAPEVRLDLPEIEGLDTVAGLAAAEGNPKHYLKELRQYLAEQTNAAERIRDLLVQGQPEEAARSTRAFRDLAANIGAATLAAAASDLEHAISRQADPADIEIVWSAMEKSCSTLLADLKSALKPKEDKAPALPPPPPVDPPVLRKAVNEILPLLTDQDPGAADCLKANRKTFRSAFSSEGFVEFERLVKTAAYHEALDLLKKAGKKHGVLR